MAEFISRKKFQENGEIFIYLHPGKDTTGKFLKNGPVAQLDRASDYGSEGWGFDSSRSRKAGQVQILMNLSFFYVL